MNAIVFRILGTLLYANRIVKFLSPWIATVSPTVARFLPSWINSKSDNLRALNIGSTFVASGRFANGSITVVVEISPSKAMRA